MYDEMLTQKNTLDFAIVFGIVRRNTYIFFSSFRANLFLPYSNRIARNEKKG